MNQNLLKAIKAIATVSEETGISPTEITKKDLSGHISDWAFKQLGGLQKIKQAYFAFDDKDLLAIQQLNNQTGYVKKLESELTKKLTLEEIAKEAFLKVKPVKVTPYKSKKKQKINRVLNLLISDTHFGSDIKAEETGALTYGVKEEARRLAFVTKETLEYKLQHREETELVVNIMGDIIDNQLHDPRVGAPLAEQSARAIHLLNQMIAQFSSAFPKVTIRFQTGNHGRNTSRHHGRATNQKWDSIESIVYFAIKETTKQYKNVNVVLPKTPYDIYEVFGQKIFSTHGDGVLNPGYPGKGIKTGNLETQINRINATLKDTDECSVFILGHVHTGSVTHLSNGATLITNGALVPVDEYAVSIGLMESAAGQMLFESVKDYPVGDIRYIKVGKKQDEDESLEQIIKPFSWNE